MGIGSIFAVFVPNNATSILLIARVLVCITLCFFNILRVSGKEICHESAKEQVKHFQIITNTKQFIINIYMITGIFLAPFMDHFFSSFIGVSFIFAIELTLVNFFNDGLTYSLIQVPQWMMLVFLSSYSIRRVATEFFAMQMEAEKTRDSLT
jgi:hypothetical protein